MANLIGEGFNNYVRKQINDRQKVYGSGANGTRSQKELTYLNSRTAWIKVASSVSVISKKDENELAKLRLKNLGLGSQVSLGKDLAKKFVLFNGVSSLERNQGSTLKQREGIKTSIDPSSTHNSAYGMGGLEFGQQPMPGIISMDLQALNMGSLKKATISLKAYNREQLQILDVLYLRLGYTLFVEFGNNLYLNKKGSVETMGSTLIEEKFFTEDLVGRSYRDLLPEIEKKRLEYCGNYDAFFGRITNYSWDFNPDGSYDIKIYLYSLGDVIESLKLNQVNTRGLLQRFNAATKEQQQYMALRFNKDYKGDDIKEFLVQQEREKNKVYEYLEEIRKWYFSTLFLQNPLEREIEYNKEELFVINDALQSSPNYGRDSVDNDSQIQSQIDAKIAYEKEIEYNGIGRVLVAGENYYIQFGSDPNADSTLFYPEPSDLFGLSDEERAKKIYDEVNNPPLTYSEIMEKSGGVPFYYSGGYKSGASNFGEYEEVDFTDTFYNTTFTIKLYRYTQDFLESENYVGNQIKLSDAADPQSLAFLLDDVTIGTKQISYYSSGDEYSLEPIGEKSKRQIFDPFSPIQTQGVAPNNRVPFPSAQDKEILSINNDRILAEQERIKDKEEELQDLIESNNNGTSTPNTDTVILNIKQLTNPIPEKVEIGTIINRLKGWSNSKLYKPLSNTSDHIFINKYNPETRAYFIRFGTLLEFIKNNILYKIDNGGNKKDNSALFLLDTDIDSNIMYTLPNHISLDPTQAIVNVNVKSIGSNIQTFEGLEPFQNTEPFYGKIMNIYLSHIFVEEQMAANVDEKGNLVLFNFLDSICTRLNIIFGGINNLHPSIDETTNCIKIYDDTPIPNLQGISEYLIAKDPKKYKFFEDIENFQWNCNTLPNQSIPYSLNLYGYNGTKNESNFVNDVKIATKVTKDMATMLSIGATANGYVVGEEATALSKWNYGLEDRYYEEIVDAEYDEKIKAELKERLVKENEEIQRNYAFMIFNNFESSQRLYYDGVQIIPLPTGSNGEEQEPLTQSGGGVIQPFQVEQNISAGTEFYRYLIASASAASESTKPAGNPQGFLPITLDVSLDGISGVKIYQKLNVDTRFLPNNYPDAMDFIIRGVSHTLGDSRWITKLSTLATSQLSNEPVLLPNFDYDIDLIESSLGPTEEMNPYPNDTIVKNFKSNSYPLIVQSEEHKKKYLEIYGDKLSKTKNGETIEFDNFEIRKGIGNPNSYAERFVRFLEKNKSNSRITLKGQELGNGADISSDLYEALIKFHDILGQDKYKPYLPILIVGGNDAFHHGPTLSPPSKYPTSNVYPFNTTHTRGLAIDIRQANPRSSTFESDRNTAIQDALWKAGFKGIIWHNPPHIHANVSPIKSVNFSEPSTAEVVGRQAQTNIYSPLRKL